MATDDEDKGESENIPPRPDDSVRLSVRAIRAKTFDWSRAVDKTESALHDLGESLAQARRMLEDDELKADPEWEKKLSKQLDRLETQFDILNSSVGDMRVSLGKIDTRLESMEKHALTKGQAAFCALIAGGSVFAAGWWIVQTYLAPILTHLPK